MLFIGIGIVIYFIVAYNRVIDTKQFLTDTEPYFRFLMEDDYPFLLSIRYNGEIDVNKLFGVRVRNGMISIIAAFFLILSYTGGSISFINVMISVIIGYVIFKAPYSQLKNYYKANLHHINLMLPYYLKSLEILIQHYTVPVALARSINTAPEVFKPGLRRLISRIEEGDASVDPYMDFAKDYPVRDSMRMMRLLYRLGIGSQEGKQDQLVMFSKTVSSLQNKSREQKYKERLEKMERQTMTMLFITGGGILLIMMLSMFMMMNF